jgi:UDP-2-acetamido-2,6-beta-L-arabino-hexul-4-ose reductase
MNDSVKIGVTGQAGFIGRHLTNYMKLKKNESELVPFEREYFQHLDELKKFVSQCDVIVHLAAINRGDPKKIYDNNVSLVELLINAIKEANHKPHIVFSSSIQEYHDNLYGASKRMGKKLFEQWANENYAKFSSLVIPNVFGAFGRPFYNSAVSTFAYQLTHGQEPTISVDAQMDLVYVNSLVERIYTIIKNGETGTIFIAPDAKMKVSAILSKFKEFKHLYLDNAIVPNVNTPFDKAIFNTFVSYIDSDHYPVTPTCSEDNRGYLIEMVKELSGGQTFFSVTKPGVTRGNHYHARKFERFCVISGEAVIRLRTIGTDKVVEYNLNGTKPSFVDISIFHTHNITNTGKIDLTTLFWTNELFNPKDQDTYYEVV